VPQTRFARAQRGAIEPDWNWPTVDPIHKVVKLAHHPLIHGFLGAFVVGSCFVELI
jgi:hypothetical protein